MRRSSIFALLGGFGVLAACVGDDPESSVSVPADGGDSSSIGNTTGDGSVDSSETGGPTQPLDDAATDAPVIEAGPSCKETSNACLETFAQKRKANCDPARETCQAKPECSSSPSPCITACKAAWLDCQDKYEKECVQCGKAANVCDPSEDCHKIFYTP